MFPVPKNSTKASMILHLVKFNKAHEHKPASMVKLPEHDHPIGVLANRSLRWQITINQRLHWHLWSFLLLWSHRCYSIKKRRSSEHFSGTTGSWNEPHNCPVSQLLGLQLADMTSSGSRLGCQVDAPMFVGVPV